MFIGWLTCIPAVLLPHSLRRFTTANAPANRQMPIASVVSSHLKKIKQTEKLVTILDKYKMKSTPRKLELDNKHTKRAVAFLDILGFKNMIENLSIDEIALKYETMIKLISSFETNFSKEKSVFEYKPLCKRFIFSDSIILIANDDTTDSFIDFVGYARRILQFSIANQMPIRGAISYGDIYINEKINVFLGKALTDAYELEGKQEWIGIILNESIEERYSELFTNREKSIIFDEILYKYNVPFKDGSFNSYRVINWRVNYIVKNGTKSLLINKENNPDVEKKIQNTLLFAKHIRDRGRIYSDKVPTLFKTFYIGDSEPPFKHGDEF